MGLLLPLPTVLLSSHTPMEDMDLDSELPTPSPPWPSRPSSTRPLLSRLLMPPPQLMPLIELKETEHSHDILVPGPVKYVHTPAVATYAGYPYAGAYGAGVYGAGVYGGLAGYP